MTTYYNIPESARGFLDKTGQRGAEDAKWTASGTCGLVGYDTGASLEIREGRNH